MQCQNNEGTLLAADRCDGLEKPAALQPCRTFVQCPRTAAPFTVHRWKTSQWSPCSVTCGSGVHVRSASCRRLNRHGGKDIAVDNAHCEGQPPTTRKPCVREVPCTPPPAMDYHWLPDEWRECSHACGKNGRQTRRVYCFHKPAAKKVHRKHCDRSSRPTRKRKCNQRRCLGHSSCADVLLHHQKQWTTALADNEYALNVHGRNVSIYCHNMRSGKPAEYLTLSKDNENYSEIYEQRYTILYFRVNNNNLINIITF